MGNKCCCAEEAMSTAKTVEKLGPIPVMPLTLEAPKEINGGKECEFALRLTRSDLSSKWGFVVVSYSNESNMLAFKDTSGEAMQEWQTNNPMKKVRIGDEIISLNGITGDAEAILGVMKTSKELEI